MSHFDEFWNRAASAAQTAASATKRAANSAKLSIAIAAEEEIEVTMIGLCTDICVVSNALLIKAYLPEIPVKVVASCCAGVTPASHEAALTTMQMCQVKIENN